jgi:hypothetical protein
MRPFAAWNDYKRGDYDDSPPYGQRDRRMAGVQANQKLKVETNE